MSLSLESAIIIFLDFSLYKVVLLRVKSGIVSSLLCGLGY